eukprot:CAMPEP_0176044764 /NCGR_PEP_ID=MMETSP0120_2-20121206/22218_1 /TAXON_ID=160619 /ORGANISM="Kryptoperidinium foliaceum, Strain CCMP 1326" /LENGTH=485 /DNA_ID=CAMNT_0017378169 /DNA_START=52 /DNA_END=1510 /DNA_ORIENTATION=-
MTEEKSMAAAGSMEKPRTEEPFAYSRADRNYTLLALCAMSAIKGADLQMLPASFRAMEVDLHLSPYDLGVLALCQGVRRWPVLGQLGGLRNIEGVVDAPRCRRLGLLHTSPGLGEQLHVDGASSAVNGVALAMLLPVTQSFVMDLSPKEERGYMFGCLYFCANLGQVLSCLFVTPMSNEDVRGIAGWRVAMLVIGVVSILASFLVPIMVKEQERRVWHPERFGASREFAKLLCFLGIPTFGVILLQGVFGTIPGAALSFTTMYFQYAGISDTMVALINALRILGDAVGGLLGGMVGDALATWSPRYGRALTAQVSVIACIPLTYMIFLGLPRTEQSWATYGGLLFLHGLVGSWVAPGCICPVMCDIVPKRCLASAYAWELAIVFASGNTLGPVLVGAMSEELFGYHLSTEQVADMPSDVRDRNADALGMSVLFASIVPYTACAILMSLLYKTYPTDAKIAHMRDPSGNGESAALVPSGDAATSQH